MHITARPCSLVGQQPAGGGITEAVTDYLTEHGWTVHHGSIRGDGEYQRHRGIKETEAESVA